MDGMPSGRLQSKHASASAEQSRPYRIASGTQRVPARQAGERAGYAQMAGRVKQASRRGFRSDLKPATYIEGYGRVLTPEGYTLTGAGGGVRAACSVSAATAAVDLQKPNNAGGVSVSTRQLAHPFFSILSLMPYKLADISPNYTIAGESFSRALPPPLMPPLLTGMQASRQPASRVGQKGRGDRAEGRRMGEHTRPNRMASVPQIVAAWLASELVRSEHVGGHAQQANRRASKGEQFDGRADGRTHARTAE